MRHRHRHFGPNDEASLHWRYNLSSPYPADPDDRLLSGLSQKSLVPAAEIFRLNLPRTGQGFPIRKRKWSSRCDPDRTQCESGRATVTASQGCFYRFDRGRKADCTSCRRQSKEGVVGAWWQITKHRFCGRGPGNGGCRSSQCDLLQSWAMLLCRLTALRTETNLRRSGGWRYATRKEHQSGRWV